MPVRKPLRLGYYDYSTPGAYFITFCTHNRKHTLSRIVEITESPDPQLITLGEVVDAVIRNIPPHLHITVDRYVIMPNHIHLILIITEKDATQNILLSATHARSIISKAVGYIKMNASKAIRKLYGDVPVWQRGFHDHIIRNCEDYEMICRYICENPLRWELDKLHSEE